MSFTLTFGQEGNCATAQVVWSVDGKTYNFRSDNNFVSWISTIFTVADYLSSSGGNTNPLVLPNNTNANGWSLNTLDNGGTGGSITMIGSAGRAGGNIITSGGDGPGGSINTSNNGGNISTNGVANYSGGNINTSASGDAGGGFIDTSADSAGGGYISTSNGGGSIDTTGTGSIGFGTSGIRTTLAGSASEDRTITMPDISGTMAVILVGSDTIDFPNIPANSTATQDVTIVGVIAGDAVLVTCTDVRIGADQLVVFTGFVASTPDTVTVLASNTSGAGINLPSLSFKIIVFKGF